jgi:hypothetical protein
MVGGDFANFANVFLQQEMPKNIKIFSTGTNENRDTSMFKFADFLYFIHLFVHHHQICKFEKRYLTLRLILVVLSGFF